MCTFVNHEHVTLSRLGIGKLLRHRYLCMHQIISMNEEQSCSHYFKDTKGCFTIHYYWDDYSAYQMREGRRDELSMCQFLIHMTTRCRRPSSCSLYPIHDGNSDSSECSRIDLLYIVNCSVLGKNDK